MAGKHWGKNVLNINLCPQFEFSLRLFILIGYKHVFSLSTLLSRKVELITHICLTTYNYMKKCHFKNIYWCERQWVYRFLLIGNLRLGEEKRHACGHPRNVLSHAILSTTYSIRELKHVDGITCSDSHSAHEAWSLRVESHIVGNPGPFTSLLWLLVVPRHDAERWFGAKTRKN